MNPANGHKRPKKGEGEGHFSKSKVHQSLTKFNSDFDDFMAELQGSSDEDDICKTSSSIYFKGYSET